MESSESTFGKQWALVELFGRQQIAGEVSEQTIAGCGFLRVDVPAIEERPGYTRFIGTAAVYGILPVDESIARRLVQRQNDPIRALHLPQLAPPSELEDDDFDPDDFDPDDDDVEIDGDDSIPF